MPAGAVGKSSKVAKSMALPNMAQNNRGLLFSLQPPELGASVDVSVPDGGRDARPKTPLVAMSLPQLPPLNLAASSADQTCAEPSPGLGQRLLLKLTGRSPKSANPSPSPASAKLGKSQRQSASGRLSEGFGSPEPAPRITSDDTELGQPDQGAAAAAVTSPLPSDSPVALSAGAALPPNVAAPDSPPRDNCTGDDGAASPAASHLSAALGQSAEADVCSAAASLRASIAAVDEDFRDAEAEEDADMFEDCRSSMVLAASEPDVAVAAVPADAAADSAAVEPLAAPAALQEAGSLRQSPPPPAALEVSVLPASPVAPTVAAAPSLPSPVSSPIREAMPMEQDDEPMSASFSPQGSQPCGALAVAAAAAAEKSMELPAGGIPHEESSSPVSSFSAVAALLLAPEEEAYAVADDAVVAPASPAPAPLPPMQAECPPTAVVSPVDRQLVAITPEQQQQQEVPDAAPASVPFAQRQLGFDSPLPAEAPVTDDADMMDIASEAGEEEEEEEADGPAAVTAAAAASNCDGSPARSPEEELPLQVEAMHLEEPVAAAPVPAAEFLTTPFVGGVPPVASEPTAMDVEEGEGLAQPASPTSAEAEAAAPEPLLLAPQPGAQAVAAAVAPADQPAEVVEVVEVLPAAAAAAFDEAPALLVSSGFASPLPPPSLAPTPLASPAPKKLLDSFEADELQAALAAAADEHLAAAGDGGDMDVDMVAASPCPLAREPAQAPEAGLLAPQLPEAEAGGAAAPPMDGLDAWLASDGGLGAPEEPAAADGTTATAFLLASPILFGAAGGEAGRHACAAASPVAFMAFEPIDLQGPDGPDGELGQCGDDGGFGAGGGGDSGGFTFDTAMSEVPPLTETPSPVASLGSSPRVVVKVCAATEIAWCLWG